jgi:Resolvase, N terminal domain
MKTAAIYARVSSAQQREENTIASQTAALVAFAQSEGYCVADEWIFQDEGYSGASLLRPGLEWVRDLAAEGQIQALSAPPRNWYESDDLKAEWKRGCKRPKGRRAGESESGRPCEAGSRRCMVKGSSDQVSD